MTKLNRSAMSAYDSVTSAHSATLSAWRVQHPQKCSFPLAKVSRRLNRYVTLLRQVDQHKLTRAQAFAIFDLEEEAVNLTPNEAFVTQNQTPTC